MTYVLEFSVFDLPKLTNDIKSWRVRMAEARRVKGLVLPLLDHSVRPVKPLEKAKLTLIRHSSMAPDPDGLVSSFKYVVDSLTEAGVIVDDNYSVIGMPTYLWKKVPQKQGFITVRVEAA